MNNTVKMEIENFIEIDISKHDIVVRKSHILELLGYGLDTRDDHVDGVINDCISISTSLIEPKGGIVFLKNENINLTEGKLITNGKAFEIGKIIAPQLKYAEYSAFFICTIGKGLENFAKEKMDQGDLLEGYVFDLIGSESVEETAGIIHNTIKEIAAKNDLKITNRFSPGYCNWNVGEQFKLFEVFRKNNLNIKLTESALMDPVKSVSGIVGVGGEVRYKSYSCSICDDKKCIYRNRKTFNNT